MTGVLRAERTKFFSVRSLPLLAGVAVLVSTLMALLFVVSLPLTQGTSIDTLPAMQVVSAALVGIDVAGIVVMVMGASFAGSEYSTGLAQPTFLLAPRRTAVVLAKAGVVAAVAVVLSVVTAALCTLVGQVALLVAGRSPAPLDTELLQLALGSALNPVFYALIALFAALIFRSTGGGIITALLVLLLPATSLLPGLGILTPLLPTSALHSLAGAADPGTTEYLAVVPAALSLLTWLVLAGAIAVWQVRTRDV